MTRFLVTGGAGFIGSRLVEALVGAGHVVRVLDDLSTGREQNLCAVRDVIDLVTGSVTDPATVHAAVKGAAWVFHLAALPSVERSVEDPMATHAVCTTGTLNVLEAARQAGVRRVVYSASSSAYGDAPGAVRREHDPCRPVSPYAVAKLAGEHYCRAYAMCFGLETVCLRFFNVFGPRQRADSPYAGVVARFIQALCRQEPLVIHGDGRQSRDFTYVDNVVSALMLAAEAEKAPGNVYNVGAGGRTRIRELAVMLSQLAGIEANSVFAEPRRGDVKHSMADLTRARQDLGYEPLVPLAEGLRRTLATSLEETGFVPGREVVLSG